MYAHIVNIYAPNSPNERVAFFKSLHKKVKQLKESENAELLIGGDFNCAFNFKIDRRQDKKSCEKKDDSGKTEIVNLMNELNLEDVWRRRNPQLKRYSYFKPNSKTASRIDYWLSEKTLDPYLIKTTIEQAIRTDHASIQCTIKTNLQERGPGYWKFNKKLLDSEFFNKALNSFWQGWKEKINDYQSKSEWWEITKYKIKKLAIDI